MVQGCEPSWLRDVYSKNAGPCLGLARRFVDRARAEEIVQEVFVALWRHSERFDPERGTLKSLLLACVRHRAIDCVRAEEARSRRELRYVRDCEAPRPSDAPWSAEQVRGALMTLPDDQRTAIVLAFYERLTYREVASVLDLPEGTVKSRIRAGLARLARALREHELAA